MTPPHEYDERDERDEPTWRPLNSPWQCFLAVVTIALLAIASCVSAIESGAM